jgi:hypothetical protein
MFISPPTQEEARQALREAGVPEEIVFDLIWANPGNPTTRRTLYNGRMCQVTVECRQWGCDNRYYTTAQEL